MSMPILDNFKKVVAVLGVAAIGATASQAQVQNIDILSEPVDVSTCIGDTTSFVDIIAQFQAPDLPFIKYKWYRYNPDGTYSSIRINSDGEFEPTFERGFAEGRLAFPAQNEKYAGRYFGEAFIDGDGDGFRGLNEEFATTNDVGVNVLTEPVILEESYMVYENDMMMEEPIGTGMAANGVFATTGNVVTINIDAHIFGEYDTSNGNEPDYDIDIQWYTINSTLDTVALMKNNTFAGVNADMLSINMISDTLQGTMYWADLTGNCGTVTTSVFNLMETPSLDFTTQPMDMTVCPGDETVITVEAVANDMNQTITYQWMMAGTPLMDDANFSGTTTNELTIAAGYITTDINDITVMATSNPSGMTVNADPFMIGVTPDAEYTVDLDGQAINLSVGDPLNLTVDATGATSYQWYQDGTAIAGETMNTLSIPATIADNSGIYKAHAINDCGTEIPSTEVAVTVTGSGVVSSVAGVIEGTVSISPNPTADVATIRLELESFVKNASVTLMNAAGQSVTTQNFENTGSISAQFDSSTLGLANGVYFVVIEVDGQSFTEELVIDRR
jgi:hypothetical protein